MSLCQDHVITEENMDDAKALVDMVAAEFAGLGTPTPLMHALASRAVAHSLAAMGVGTEDEDLPRCEECGEFFDEPGRNVCEDCVAHA